MESAAARGWCILSTRLVATRPPPLPRPTPPHTHRPHSMSHQLPTQAHSLSANQPMRIVLSTLQPLAATRRTPSLPLPAPLPPPSAHACTAHCSHSHIQTHAHARAHSHVMRTRAKPFSPQPVPQLRWVVAKRARRSIWSRWRAGGTGGDALHVVYTCGARVY